MPAEHLHAAREFSLPPEGSRDGPPAKAAANRRRGLTAAPLIPSQDSPCFYDSPQQVRCVTARWTPEESLKPTTGALAPGYEAWLYVSNDAGELFSDQVDEAVLIYSNIIVSAIGSDAYGDGTQRAPYRTITRGLAAALDNPRPYYVTKGPEYRVDEHSETQRQDHLRVFGGRQHQGARGRSLASYINSDKVEVAAGIYRDELSAGGARTFNLHLSANKKVVEIVGVSGMTYIDCQNKEVDHLKPYEGMGMHEEFAETHGAISLTDIGVVRCTGTTLWENLDSKRRPNVDRARATGYFDGAGGGGVQLPARDGDGFYGLVFGGGEA